jgi:hypothetical protein
VSCCSAGPLRRLLLLLVVVVFLHSIKHNICVSAGRL